MPRGMRGYMSSRTVEWCSVPGIGIVTGASCGQRRNADDTTGNLRHWWPLGLSISTTVTGITVRINQFEIGSK